MTGIAVLELLVAFKQGIIIIIIIIDFDKTSANQSPTSRPTSHPGCDWSVGQAVIDNERGVGSLPRLRVLMLTTVPHITFRMWTHTHTSLPKMYRKCSNIDEVLREYDRNIRGKMETEHGNMETLTKFATQMLCVLYVWQLKLDQLLIKHV